MVSVAACGFKLITCGQEQKTLETPMRQHVEYCRHKGPYAACHDHESNLTDRRIGQDLFDVTLR